MVTSLKRKYAVRGAIMAGAAAALLFGMSVQPILAASICGIVTGMAFHPFANRWTLASLLGTGFALIQSMFMLPDPPSARLTTMVWDGLATAFAFWTVGAAATLTLPAHLRSNAAATWAVSGGLAGVAFQVLRGFQSMGWAYLVLWLIAASGCAWGFGVHLDRRLQTAGGKEVLRGNPWGMAAAASGVAGLGVGGAFLLRNQLPLGLRAGFSPTAEAADWFWSWALVGITMSLFGIFARQRAGRGWAVIGATLALSLFTISLRIDAGPWKVPFNTAYGTNLLESHNDPQDPRHAYAVYTGNLILAHAALDTFDYDNAGRRLLQAASISGLGGISENGPDMSVASTLLQRGRQETVLEYLAICERLWPEGQPVLERWKTAIRQGRRVNFNNRTVQR
jgi:hypothetical protein